VILGDTNAPGADPRASVSTLDSLFDYGATRRPDAVALIDPPNRSDFTDGAARRMTYAQADRAISAIAARLHALGLRPDTVVGIQLPNTIEAALTILGVIRAGMIAAPLPLLWRHAELADALGRLGAQAIVTTTRAGTFSPCDLAMRIAAELFHIRHVCSFGHDPPDGVVPFDELLDERITASRPVVAREGNAASHVAMVTWTVTPSGRAAVARNHTELIAGGLGVMLECALPQNAKLLGGLAISSFVGFAATVMPWLLSGGTLTLHHGFDPDAFAAQRDDVGCDTMVVPGALVPPLQDAGLFDHPALTNVLAVWQAPERLSVSPTWRHPNARLMDMLAFGDIAILGSRRDSTGRPQPLPALEMRVPRERDDGMRIADMARTLTGTLALRGPMVPRHAFPPGIERLHASRLQADAGGFVDTGYSCRIDRTSGTLGVTAPPLGIVTIGGYHFLLGDLTRLVKRANVNAYLTALPDTLTGHRLAGIAGLPDDVHARLAALGANPLLVSAFGQRHKPKAA
jgi:acyl-CoA synthetase (AMP-forming)/AMP-acid ligase II